MSPWFFNLYMDVVMIGVKMRMGWFCVRVGGRPEGDSRRFC